VEKLIFDRTQADIINNTSKGQYNAEDLNRIEEWCKFLAETLTEYGYKLEISTKTDWVVTDYPSNAEMDRIWSNVNTLKNAYYSFTRIPDNFDKIDIEKANKIEKILSEINEFISNMLQTFVYSGVAGLGQNRVWQQRFRRGYSWVSQNYRLDQYAEYDTVALIASEEGKKIDGTEKLNLAKITSFSNIADSIATINNSMVILDTISGKEA
jgi:hypothetical protein